MLGFLIAAGAGFVVPMLEDLVGESLAERLRQKMPIAPEESRVIALLMALLAAALLALAFDSGNAFSVALGLTLGYFGTRLFALVKAAIDGK